MIWQTKPPYGTQLSGMLGLQQGLLGFWPLNEGGGTINADSLYDLILTLAGGATWAQNRYGTSLVCNASNARAQANWPTEHSVAWPITVITAFTVVANESGSGLIFGLWPKPLALFYSSGQTVAAFRNSGGTLASGLITAVGGTYVVAYEQATSTSGRFYINGVLDVTSSTSLGAASYASTNVAFGDSTSFTGRTAGIASYWGGIWNRVLSVQEHAFIGSNVSAIWQMFTFRGVPYYVPSVTAAIGSNYFGSSRLRPFSLPLSAMAVQAKYD